MSLLWFSLCAVLPPRNTRLYLCLAIHQSPKSGSYSPPRPGGHFISDSDSRSFCPGLLCLCSLPRLQHVRTPMIPSLNMGLNMRRPFHFRCTATFLNPHMSNKVLFLRGDYNAQFESFRTVHLHGLWGKVCS